MKKLYSVVGLSGSGKSTAVEGVQGLLTIAGIESRAFHDRTSDIISHKIDAVFQSADLTPEARMYMVLAARRQIVERNIKPSLLAGYVTLTDRYYPCTIAYQAYGQGLDKEVVEQATMLGVRDAMPVRIFYLDISGADAKNRMNARGGKEQIFDTEAEAFHERVRRGYKEQAETDSRFEVINVLQKKEVIASYIANIIISDSNKDES